MYKRIIRSYLCRLKDDLRHRRAVAVYLKDIALLVLSIALLIISTMVQFLSKNRDKIMVETISGIFVAVVLMIIKKKLSL